MFDFKLPGEDTKTQLPETITIGEGENAKELNLKELLFNVIEKSGNNARKQFDPKMTAYEQKLAEMTEQINAIKTEKTEMERAKMTANELKEAQFKDLQTQLESVKIDKEKNFDLFKRTKMNNDILNALSKIEGVRKPANVARLLSLDTEIIQDGDSFNTVMNINGEKRNIETAVSDWFKQDGNDIYLSPSLTPGGNTSQSAQTQGNQTNTMTRQNFDTLSAVEKMSAVKQNIKLTD